jgi:hypothetical protein
VGVSSIADPGATMMVPLDARSLFKFKARRNAFALSRRCLNSFIFVFYPDGTFEAMHQGKVYWPHMTMREYIKEKA